MNIIEVNNLSKYYYVNKDTSLKNFFKIKKAKHSIKALDNIDFSIAGGECVGLIGMNGAGKSTLIKIIVGILQPTSGEVKLFNLVSYKNRKQNNYQLATVFGQRTQLRWDLTIKDSYELIKEIYNVGQADYDNRLKQVKEGLQLTSFFNQPIRTLSLGQKMRAELGAAFLYDAKVLFLDEPTIGVDFFSKEAILKFIEMIKKQGTTIIFTSHDIDDVKRLCDRLIVLDHGKIILDKNISEINLADNKILDIHLKNDQCKKLDKDYLKFLKDNHLIIDNVNEDDLKKLFPLLRDANAFEFKNQDFKDLLKEIYKQYGS